MQSSGGACGWLRLGIALQSGIELQQIDNDHLPLTGCNADSGYHDGGRHPPVGNEGKIVEGCIDRFDAVTAGRLRSLEIAQIERMAESYCSRCASFWHEDHPSNSVYIDRQPTGISQIPTLTATRRRRYNVTAIRLRMKLAEQKSGRTSCANSTTFASMLDHPELALPTAPQEPKQHGAGGNKHEDADGSARAVSAEHCCNN